MVAGQASQVEGPRPNEPGIELPVQTVDDLYTMAASTIAEGGTIHATWGDGGIPVSITFDPIPKAIDDELGITVMSVTPRQ